MKEEDRKLVKLIKANFPDFDEQRLLSIIDGLEAELESHTWEISPAMAQAKIDELNKDRDHWKSKAMANADLIEKAVKDGSHWKSQAEAFRGREAKLLGELDRVIHDADRLAGALAYYRDRWQDVAIIDRGITAFQALAAHQELKGVEEKERGKEG